jgi:D-alanyl-D-alanine carboxypeptidase/D-alanyl-D-alanine-endopeptidase (penicillin-binding protein 4)
MMVTRRWVIAGLLAGAAGSALAEAPVTSPRPVARPAAAGGLAAPALRKTLPGAAAVTAAKLGGRVAYLVADAATGAVLDARDPESALPPASTIKAITTLYALDRLGPAFRFGTRLLATGPVAGGRIGGDLVLAGSGDPTLSTDILAAMAAGLRARGVTGVTGRFLVNEGALPALPRIAADQPDHVGYNPAVSGLNLNFNRVHFEWRRAGQGWDVAMDARSDLYVPPVRMARIKVVARDLPVYTFAEQGGVDSWTVASAALGKGGSRWLPVRQPGAYAGDVFRTLARAQGIDLPDPAPVRSPPQGTVLVQAASDPLPDMLQDMLKFSTNLTAEAVGLTATGGGVATLAASARQMSLWAAAQFGRAGQFVDHSGLGAESRASPADMVAALILAKDGPLPAMMKRYPLRDAKGREVRDHPLGVVAKTGTLNFVSGLTGYVAVPDGRTLVFAIYAADTARRDAVPMDMREEPPGGAAWLRRARILQSQLIEGWAGVSG